jgi:hypothetical protein
MTYRIETTDGTLTDRQRAMTYGTPADAAGAIRVHMGWDEVVLGERFPHDQDVDAWCAYETEEDEDALTGGGYAPRVVETKKARSVWIEDAGDSLDADLAETRAAEMTQTEWIASEAAAEIVAQMSAEDLRDYTRAAWVDGVSAMLVDDWKGLDLDEVLDGVDAIRPRLGLHSGWYPPLDRPPVS